MYIVSILNQPVSKPMSLQEALSLASRAVYASPSTQDKAVRTLRGGREVTWAYGYMDVTVSPVV